MIYKYFKKLALVVFAGLAITGKGQTIFVETFGTFGAPAWTSTMNASHTEWDADESNCSTCLGTIPECNVAGSSSFSIVYSLNSTNGVKTMTTKNINTTNFTNMFISWNGYRQTGAPTITLSVSSNGGGSWTNVAFTDVATNAGWLSLTPVSIPSFCEGINNFQVRWQYTGDGTGNYFALDDIYITGSPFPVFYMKAGGNPSLLTDWGVNTNGSGLNPTSFTGSGQTFYMDNNASVTLNSAWTFGGAGSLLVIGNGMNMNFNINSSLTFITGGQMQVMNASTVTCQSVASSTSVTGGDVILNVGSTVDFAQTTAGCAVWDAVYDNLTISGGVDKSSGSVIIDNVLNLSASNLIMSNSSAQTLRLLGTITGSGIIKTGNSNLIIGGTGTLGTLTFGTGGTTQSINKLIMNRTASGLTTLGSSLTVNGDASFTNGKLDLNGKALQLNGKITFPASAANSTLKGSKASSVNIGGAGTITNSLFMDQTSSTTKALNDLTLNRAGETVTLGNSIEIWGSLTPSVGTIAAGSALLTLKSDASNKGRVGIISATGALTTGAAGITVETLAKSGSTGWTTMGSAGIQGKTFSDWNDNFAITCSTCPDGSTVGGQTFTSISDYIETLGAGSFSAAAHYVDIVNVTDPMTSAKGYWVYLGNGYPNTGDITINVSGTPNTGNLAAIPLTLTGGASAQNGWNLISNPYPSPISFTTMISGNANIDPTLYVWNPDLNAGSGNFATFAGGVSSPLVGAGGVDDNIPTGQAFYIQLIGGAAAQSISPVETWKSATASPNALLKSNAVVPTAQTVFRLHLTGGPKNANYETVFHFNSNATNGHDLAYDAFDLPGGDPMAAIIASYMNNNNYRINGLPQLTNGTINIPVKTLTGYNGTYQIAPVDISNLPAGACVNLFDKFTNTTHNLRTGPYSFTLLDTTTVARFELIITLNNTTLTSSSSNPVCLKQNTGKVIAVGNTAGPWNYTWKDLNNNVIKTTNNITTSDTLKNLISGTYKVDINTVGSCDNASATFNIMATTPAPIAAYNVNYDSLSIYGTTQFQFTNTSFNASIYSWNFGDCTSSALANPSYLYKKDGDYDVTLYAMNTCGDSAKYKYQVHATGVKPQVGIAKIAAPESSIKIGKDENGAFVQLNFDKLTKATVSVSNILGQVILSPKAVEGTTERFYINLNSFTNQLLFITVDTSDKHITQKLFNN